MKYLLLILAIVGMLVIVVFTLPHPTKSPVRYVGMPNAVPMQGASLIEDSGTQSSAILSIQAPSSTGDLDQVVDVNSWPRFSDTFISIPYPPSWSYQIEESDGFQLTVQFSDPSDANFNDNGGEVDIWKQVGTSSIQVLAGQGESFLSSEISTTPNTERHVTLDGYPAIEYDFDYIVPSSSGSQLYIQCGNGIISAYFWVPSGDDIPAAWQTTAMIHAIFGAITVKSCPT